MIDAIRNFILDTLFPITCLSCGQPGAWLCDSCVALISAQAGTSLPVLRKKHHPWRTNLLFCQGKSALSGLLVASHYKNTVPTAVHYFKYRYIEGFQDPLGKILAKAYLDSDLPLPDIIIPVPLHKRRLRLRGFNQSELLADFLGQNLAPGFEIPVISNLLIRNRYTHPQMEIKDYSRRQKNLEGAFSISEEISIDELKGKNVLLVDDVATTASTLFECAKVLKKSGAKEVFGIVIARQEYKIK